MTTWVHYDPATGAIRQAGLCANEAEAGQQVPAKDLHLLVLPDGLIGGPLTPEPDLSRLRLWLQQQIDAQAARLFAGVVTDIAGQDRRYLLKAREAREWSEGDEVTHPERYPFMLAARDAAAAVGADVTMMDIRDQILAQSAASAAAEADIEARRVTHKQLIRDAGNLAQIIEAAAVSWPAA
ncbi:hypothetical protein GRI97_08070 [Altererythrobacter xixiisoli]|uniref:Uncharacterized protein n=1 Tax=Croceibacterium xixiisoli TaxID=1476466 RepID=A0A6I4TST1_9SPHN|nr:hypothetical protein [Croceibacterium xixiisoli]MXO98942.1 hypothetical protein [Croceibacterium xixiisoli]